MDPSFARSFALGKSSSRDDAGFHAAANRTGQMRVSALGTVETAQASGETRMRRTASERAEAITGFRSATWYAAAHWTLSAATCVGTLRSPPCLERTAEQASFGAS